MDAFLYNLRLKFNLMSFRATHMSLNHALVLILIMRETEITRTLQ